MKKLPVVAIIGQTNAGKSSLLNRLARRNIAITAREAGTTRDNVFATVDNRFILIDTAGLKDPADDFEASIQDQITDAIDTADVIILAVDHTMYPNHDDHKIAREALKSKKPIILALNKSDTKSDVPEYEFLSLRIPTVIHTSATTALGIPELKSAIYAALKVSADASSEGRPQSRRGQNDEPRDDAREEWSEEEASNSRITLALIGRPNVGKSSLLNALGQKQQALVANRAGTTRDINRMTVKYHGTEIELLDTAGLRRPGKREVGVEKFSAIRTLAAIEEADVCALLVDATDPRVKLDQTLAGEIIKAGKGIMIIVTKTDLLKEEADLTPEEPEIEPLRITTAKEAKNAKKELSKRKHFSKPQLPDTRKPVDRILDNIVHDFNFVQYAPVVVTSAITGKNLPKIFELAAMIAESRKTQIKTSDLNNILAETVEAHRPATHKGVTPRPKYIVQTDTCPPWFVIHGHGLGALHFTYMRYIENQIRAHHPLVGTPIRISIRSDDDKRKKSKD